MPNTGDCAKWLKAIGEPMRLQIVQILMKQPLAVSAIAEAVGGEIALVSHHLQVLLHADIVHVSKQGRFSVYCINPEFHRRASKQRGPGLDFGCCRFELS